ncbi:MAG: helix-turn-helix domain-containing protein [Mycobacterium sp.]
MTVQTGETSARDLASQRLMLARTVARQAAETAVRARRFAVQAARDASRAGFTPDEIARVLRVSNGTVARWIA